MAKCVFHLDVKRWWYEANLFFMNPSRAPFRRNTAESSCPLKKSVCNPSKTGWCPKNLQPSKTSACRLLALDSLLVWTHLHQEGCLHRTLWKHCSSRKPRISVVHKTRCIILHVYRHETLTIRSRIAESCILICRLFTQFSGSTPLSQNKKVVSIRFNQGRAL